MNSRSHHYFLFVILQIFLAVCLVKAQQPNVSPSPDDRLKADILVVVAHPDDESLIAGYLAKAVLDEHKRVAVVFTTRGDAGQNLVGYEQAKSLAEIREMEARQALASIGIENEWFLRGPDTPWLEVPDVLRSLEAWNHGNILGEVVRFIRLTRPAVVITMLPDIVVGENHEDHQASGVVATEAFDLAGDPTWFPEQIGDPADRLWFANLMEGLHVWQPQKLYYFTDASHFDFLKGKGPEYSMTEVSPSQHLSYARIAAKEVSLHRTQYDGEPDRDLQAGNLSFYEEPLTFILGKSLVGGTVTGDVFENVVQGQIGFARVRGYEPPKDPPDYSIELGGGWAFYNRFWPAHNLESLTELLSPELGVGTGQDFPIPLILRNNTDKPVTMDLHPFLPNGWAIDSNSAQYAHHPLPQGKFIIPARDYVPVVVRLIAPTIHASSWQTVSWSAEVEGKSAGRVTVKFYVMAE
ncbi:MAG TPA: PIG-L family deacetylase [Candidatus Kryptonia bacterium]